jgi:hypothetical protein
MDGSSGADSLHQLVNSQLLESAKMTLPLSSHCELADGGQSCGGARRMLKLYSVVNFYSWEYREAIVSWVDAALGICCTRCMLYSVYACTHWNMYLVSTYENRMD